MKQKYTYKNNRNLLKNINFEYFETYSLQRGEKLEKKIKSLESEFDKIKSKTDRNETLKNRLSEFHSSNCQ
ncbi:hypothetical protein [Algibacter sp. L1A34]|uniref:hypothetical protein n=1 Tax=Algibacter sp. L1A34 TaxID=2686365 RepID=UPI00131D1E43|nr:hypothetical protein [Algibacter sp. L1A34]